MHTKSLIAMALATVASIGVASAQVQISQDGRPERMFRPVSGLNTQDMKFLKQLQIANEFEIQSSQIAVQNGTSSFTKEFAKEMIQDHNGAQDEAKQLSTSKGFNEPTVLPKDLQSKLNQLHSLNGDNFDSTYRSDQMSGHAAAIQAFKAEIRNGRDQDVKALAVKLLPVVEEHYKLALQKKTMMGPDAATHGS